MTDFCIPQALRAGSVIAEAVLEQGLYDDGRRPMDAVRMLSTQVHDASSILRTGRYTHSAAGLRLRNPEPPAPPVSDVSPSLQNADKERMSRDDWINQYSAALEDSLDRSSADR